MNANLSSVMEKKRGPKMIDSHASYKEYNSSSVSNSVLKSNPNISGIVDNGVSYSNKDTVTNKGTRINNNNSVNLNNTSTTTITSNRKKLQQPNDFLVLSAKKNS